MNFDLLPIKLIFFALLLWPISRVWLRFKDGGVRLGSFLFWTAIWCVGVFVIFFPGALSYIAKILGIGRGSDLAIYTAIGVLFYLVFRTNVMLENVRNEISRVVREVALQNQKSKSKK